MWPRVWALSAYMYISVWIAGIGWAQWPSFSWIRENTVGPMKRQGLERTDIDRSEKSGGRAKEAERVGLLTAKAPQSPVTVLCVRVLESVPLPLWCHYRLSRSQGSPCLPSMFSELSLWELCIRHRHGNQQMQRACLDVTFKCSLFSMLDISLLRD